MNITHEKLKKECAEFYRIGYKTAISDVILRMKAVDNPQSQENQIFLDKCIDNLMDYFNKYPLGELIMENIQ